MMRICHDQGISLDNSFYWNVCSVCGLIWIPSKSALVALHTFEEIRLKKSIYGLRIVLASRLLYLDARQRQCANGKGGLKERKVKRRKEYYITYHCRGCHSLTVFDSHPYKLKDKNDFLSKNTSPDTEITIPGPMPTPTITNTTATGRQTEQQKKLAQLQKVLNRSSNSASPTPSNPLTEFLKRMNK